MKISELARRPGTTTRALRYYEEQGLLGPSRRSNGYREYADPDVRRVANIQYLLSLGTADVLLFVDCLEVDWTSHAACPPAVELARHRLAELDERLASLAAVRSRLASVVADGERQLAEAG
ncbi:MerR family transcriptional regulator [Tenggerimyces flavus]|uniref:MerR family transcriptional regulator n=1 Tax=Tenggerimyces flavus TaxID=1708749 RepID=A0ABV7YCB1_9ACTN|nr:MerR family transcriptional regulator [Tenggerimyces flavus]MBM7786937.1 DNA-binding transcriptional MerR regulator [Tenggerimyces flavus]